MTESSDSDSSCPGPGGVADAQRGLATRLTAKGVAVVSRPSTVMRQLSRDGGERAVGRAIERIAAPSRITRCCYVECNREFEWMGSGRTPRFCSAACRVRFSKEKARLKADLTAYEELGDNSPTTWEQSVELDRRKAALRMQLDRYRDF